MNRPVLAEPLNESEKMDLFEKSKALLNERMDVDRMRKETLLRYVSFFVKKNKLNGYIVKGMFKTKMIVSIVFSVLIVLSYAWFFYYDAIWGFMLLVLELGLLPYINFQMKRGIKQYLLNQVVLLPDDKIDDILVSKVGDAEKVGCSWFLLTLLPFVVFAITLAAFGIPL